MIFLGLTLFTLGLIGIIINRSNLIGIIMSIEVLLLSVNYNILMFSLWTYDLVGEILSLIILTVAAAESAIGLALIVVLHRIKGTISIKYLNILKG